MDWFLPLVDENKLHIKFKLLLDLAYTTERNLFADWTKVFVVKDGIKKTVKEFQTTFHSIFWEVYLNKLSNESGCIVNNKVKSPDFYLSKNNNNVCMEAVVANIAECEAREHQRTTNDVFGENDYYQIVNESIIRAFNAISVKLKMYREHYSDLDIAKKSPFVIALGDYGQINYGQSYCYPLLALLYNAFYDPEDKEDLLILCTDTNDREYKYKENIAKGNGTTLKLGLFSDDTNDHISAILYSCMMTLGKLSSLSKNHVPYSKTIKLVYDCAGAEFDMCRHSGSQPDETLFDGTFIFHNPYAKKRLPIDFFQGKGLVHIYYTPDDGVIKFIPENTMPLKRRFVSMTEEAATFIPDYDNLIWGKVKKNPDQ